MTRRKKTKLIKAKLSGEVGHGVSEWVKAPPHKCPQPDVFVENGEPIGNVGDTKGVQCWCGKRWIATLAMREREPDQEYTTQLVTWTEVQ